MRFSKYLALIAVAVMGVSSCEEDKFTTNETDTGTVLYASTDQSSLSKLTFSDNTSSIDLQWEADDAFTIYDSKGEELGTFKCTDIESGKFESEDLIEELSIDSTYTAKYNELENADAVYSQNGDEIDNLNNACQMVAEFKYGEDETITFKHTMAVMTFKFASEDRPAYLIFENGEEQYTVSYTSIEPVNSVYTSHIMINPCDATERTLVFSLYNSEDVAYDIRKVTTSKAYVAGCRYTSPVSDLENIVWEGSGKESSPYQIVNAAQLRQLSTNVSEGVDYYGVYFEMMNNIDLGGIDDNGEGVESNEFAPIGYYNSSDDYNEFRGTFDGGGYEVSGLYINKPSSNYQGLFGYISSATIKNLGVSGIVIGGTERVGGVVGSSTLSSTVINCYNKAKVSASGFVGGVVGYNSSTVLINCYNLGDVTGSVENVGGVVGFNMNSTVANSYNKGAISGSDCVGGIVGDNRSSDGSASTFTSVINCYSAGTVSGSSCVGGVVGANTYNYAVSSSNYAITNCYFDHDIFSGNAVGYNNGGEVTDVLGYETSFMKSASFVTFLNNNAYTYNQTSPSNEACSWVVESEDYPTLNANETPSSYSDFADVVSSCTEYGTGTESDPYLIMTSSQMRDLSSDVSGGETYSEAYFKMFCDIDLGGEDNEFTAIGYYNSSTDYPSFNGTFDGGGYEVSGLYINTEISGQGLFGYISEATIKNLGVSGSVTGYRYTASLVGYCVSSSTVINCYSSVDVNGIGSNVGGIVGRSSASTVANCYNSGDITLLSSYKDAFTPIVGGVIGKTHSTTVSSCYNTGNVTSNVTVATQSTPTIGGIVGLVNSSDDVIMNCYYDSDIFSGDGVGYTNSYEVTNVLGYSSSFMQGATFVALLNSAAYTYNNSDPTPAVTACAWKATTGGYPTFDAEGVPMDLMNVSSCTAYGTGTESDPYLIYSVAQLRDLSSDVGNDGTNYSGKYFEMMWDIDLGGIYDDGEGVAENEFTAIGNSDNSFEGIFDGGGYEISGLYINSSNYHQGLFGYISEATIKNLGVSGSVTGGDYNTAGVVGNMTDASMVSNCYNSATVKGSLGVGGVAGFMGLSSKVTNCYNTGAVTGTSTSVGGVVGTVSGAASLIDNCYNKGKVTGSKQHVGGVVGTNNTSTVSNCYNTGQVSTLTKYVGGVVGQNQSYSYGTAKVINCYSTGLVSGASNVGGVVGYNFNYSATITNCYYDSTVYSGGSASGDTNATFTNVSGKATSELTSGSFALTLGDEFKEDYTTKINSGYPILLWQ